MFKFKKFIISNLDFDSSYRSRKVTNGIAIRVNLKSCHFNDKHEITYKDVSWLDLGLNLVVFLKVKIELCNEYYLF